MINHHKIKQKIAIFKNYLFIILFLALTSFFGYKILEIFPTITEEHDFQLFIFGSILFLGYVINRSSPKTKIPSFVWLIFAGLAIQPLLSFFIEEKGLIRMMIEVIASLILFASGLEIPFGRFKRWFFPIFSLSFFGVILSSVLFSTVIFYLFKFLGLINDNLVIISLVLLSTALASTDPTAILPTLKNINLKRNFIKDIAISESALTDVSGSIFTRFLILAFSAQAASQKSIIDYFLPLIKKSTYDALALQIISGIVVGYFGYYLIKTFYKSPKKENHDIDPSLLIFVPIFTFFLGNVLGGAGFLAAFSAGLFSDLNEEVKKNFVFFDHFLNNLIKPVIFVVLGAMVPISVMIKTSLLGILIALIFMFIIRPLVVFISLFPWIIKGRFKPAEILFLSFIRETGVIGAVLIIILVDSGIVNENIVLSLGMWIILLTLIIEPPLTPLVVKKIGLEK
jgi:cell volume regulation protein A